LKQFQINKGKNIMIAALTIQASLSEIEQLLLSAAEKSYPQPLNARTAQNYSRKLKTASLSDIRSAMLSLSQTNENVHIEGEGNAIALLWCPSPDIFDEEETPLPETTTALEWKTWRFKKTSDREELEEWAKTSKAVQMPWGVVNVGSWVRREDRLDENLRPMQIVGIENSSAIALVSFFGLPNMLDSIPCHKLYFCSEPPDPHKNYGYPRPFHETFRILEAPPEPKKPVATLQTKLEAGQIELEKAKQNYKMAEDNYYSCKVKCDSFMNQAAPDQSKMTIAEFLELRSKIEFQTEGHKKALARVSEVLNEALADLDDAVQLVAKLTAEVDRHNAILAAENAFQQAFQGYCDTLQILYTLKVFDYRDLGNFNRIPNFKDGKIQYDHLSEILGA
jgi:hypothetical protein